MAAKPFKITIPIFKAFKDEDGNIYIRGLGGDAEPDYDPRVKRIERLSIDCIKDLQKQVVARSIPLIPRHFERGGAVITDKPEWDDTLGITKDLIVTPYGQMFPLIKLDESNYRALTLFNKIEDGSQLGLSWGGLPIAWHTEFDEHGMEVRVFDKLELWHFAVTTKPINGRSLNNPLSVVAKSVDWKDAESIKTDTVTFQVEYPERSEVQAMFKSYREGDTENYPAYKGADNKDNLEEEPIMTPEQLKAMQESFEASIKAALAPINTEIASIKAAQAAAPAAPAAKAGDALDATKVAEIVKSALDARDDAAAKSKDDAAAVAKATEDAATKAKELNDAIVTAVNKALENVPGAGLKSKPGGTDDPANAEQSAVVKALEEIKTGLKTIDDFSPVIQRALEDFSAKAFQQIESTMPAPSIK